MSQFAFLQAEWPTVYDAASRAAAAVHPDPRTACFYARRALELAVAWAYRSDGALRMPYQDNLSALMAAKKPITVVLQNGQSYRATIGSVGDHLVVLNGPSQKEFYDVLIPIEEIAAVEVRVRDQ